MPSISSAQWRQIWDKGLGLRSGSTPEDINSAASYAMDCGMMGMAVLGGPPGDWDTGLRGTLETIKGFANAEGRYLLIVTGSRGQSNEYKGAFPKCSTKPTGVVAATLIGGTDTETLFGWVIKNIPDH